MKNLLLLVVLGSTGCVQASLTSPPSLDTEIETRRCEVGALAGAASIRAVEGGLVYAKTSKDDTVLVRRMTGDGCDLTDAGGPSIAAGELLDADDLGNVYTFPAEATDPDVISTMLPDEYAGSMVARVDAQGVVSKLLPAGRGIWGFGVTASGDALWVSACGPNGLFDIAAGTAQPAAWTPGDTLWEQSSSAITDRDTFWSVGVRTCGPGGALTPDCGFALTRSTREGSVEVGTTVIDFGGGFVQTTLARCGSRACGFEPNGAVVWDERGGPIAKLTLADLGADPAEHVVEVTGNEGGLYVMLAGGAASRVVFVPED